jgi:hypothetical protein
VVRTPGAPIIPHDCPVDLTGVRADGSGLGHQALACVGRADRAAGDAGFDRASAACGVAGSGRVAGYATTASAASTSTAATAATAASATCFAGGAADAA